MTFAMRLNGGDLIRDGEKVKHDGFTVTVMKDGTGFGKAEPLFKTIHTLMTNGSQERISGFGNRAPAIMVKIEGETPDGLNAGGVWLSSLMRPGALEWLPPDQKVWTVFDVVTCYVDRTEDEGWDFQETQWIRNYRIPIKALPHSRSRFLTNTPALPLASTPIVDELVTDALSLTGWTAGWTGPRTTPSAGSLTPTLVSGRVRLTDTVSDDLPGDDPLTLALAYAFGGPVPDETPFLRVDYRINTGVALAPAIATNGGPINLLPLKVTGTDVGGGVFSGTAYYRVPAGTRAFAMRAIQVDSDGDRKPDFGGWLEVDQIRRVSRLPDTGTNRQKLAAITPGGSAPAEGSLHVSHPTAGLGKVLVATYPLGRPSPALMQHRTSAQTAVNDAAAINGGWVPLNPVVAQMTVPESGIHTRGLVALWAKVKVEDAPVRLRWTVTPRMGGNIVAPSQTEVVTVPITASMLVPLGLVTLPGAAIGPAGVVEVRLSISGDDSGDGLAWVDEMWTLGQDEDSSLNIVDAGTGTPASGGPSNQLWINAPTGEKPTGEILVGTNLLDARWPPMIHAGPEVHRFGRDGVACLTVTCGATDVSTEFNHFKRWDHFAAEES